MRDAAYHFYFVRGRYYTTGLCALFCRVNFQMRCSNTNRTSLVESDKLASCRAFVNTEKLDSVTTKNASQVAFLRLEVCIVPVLLDLLLMVVHVQVVRVLQ